MVKLVRNNLKNVSVMCDKDKQRIFWEFIKNMAKLQEQLEQLQTQLADPILYQDEQKQRLKSLINHEASVKQALTDLEESWLLDQEELENLSAQFESEQ